MEMPSKVERKQKTTQLRQTHAKLICCLKLSSKFLCELMLVSGAVYTPDLQLQKALSPPFQEWLDSDCGRTQGNCLVILQPVKIHRCLQKRWLLKSICHPLPIVSSVPACSLPDFWELLSRGSVLLIHQITPSISYVPSHGPAEHLSKYGTACGRR